MHLKKKKKKTIGKKQKAKIDDPVPFLKMVSDIVAKCFDSFQPMRNVQAEMSENFLFNCIFFLFRQNGLHLSLYEF